MLEEYEKTLVKLFDMLYAELSVPFSSRRPERIECIKGMIEDVSYVVKYLRPSDKLPFRPLRSTVLARPALYLADG